MNFDADFMCGGDDGDIFVDEELFSLLESKFGEAFDPEENSLCDIITEELTPQSPKRKKPRYVKKEPFAVKEESQVVKDWIQKHYAETSIPKVLKNDIRKSYISMFANVMNHADFSLYFKYLSTYGSPAFAQQFSMQISDANMNGIPKYIKHHSIVNSAQHWYNEMQALPDMTLELMDATFHVYSNTKRSKIVGHFKMTATQIYNISYYDVIPAESVITQFDGSSETKALSTKTGVTSSFCISNSNVGNSDTARMEESIDYNTVMNKDIHDIITKSPLLAEPIPMLLRGTVTMYVDENGRIERMDIATTERNAGDIVNWSVLDDEGNQLVVKTI